MRLNVGIFFFQLQINGSESLARRPTVSLSELIVIHPVVYSVYLGLSSENIDAIVMTAKQNTVDMIL